MSYKLNRKHIYVSFGESKRIVRSLKITTSRAWRKYLSKLSKKARVGVGVPCCPNLIYKDKGWKGYADWFGKVRKRKKLVA